MLAAPLAVTTIGPEVALAGTGTTMLVLDQDVGTPAVPLKVTVLDPCVNPKFDPLIVIEVPTLPLFADKPIIVGGAYDSVAASNVTLAPPI